MSDTITPAALAEEIGVSPKSLRGWLRANYTRPVEAKGKSWIITADAADAARDHFAKQETPAEGDDTDTDEEVTDTPEDLDRDPGTTE